MLKKLRAKADAEFREKGFPTTKEELWRFTDVSPLADTEFHAEWKPALVGFEPIGKLRVVFENGRLSLEKSTLNELPAGVEIGSIMDRADERLGSLAGIQSAFVAANTAYFSDGAFIEVARRSGTR